MTINDTNDECPEFQNAAPIIGQVSRQDVYVLDSDTLQPLVLQVTDADLVSKRVVTCIAIFVLTWRWGVISASKFVLFLFLFLKQEFA